MKTRQKSVGLLVAALALTGMTAVANAQTFNGTEGYWTPTPSGKTLAWRSTGGIPGETMAIDGNNNFVVTSTNNYRQYPGTGIFAGTGGIVNGAMQAFDTAAFNALNANDTPWVSATWIDRQNADGTWPQFLLFVNGPDAGGTGRILASSGYAIESGLGWRTESGADITSSPWGAPAGYDRMTPPAASDTEMGLFSMTGNTWQRVTPSFATTTGANQNATNASAADMGIPYADRVQRVNGSTVTVTIGKLADGTIEYTWTQDATTFATFSNTFIINDGGNPGFDFSQVELTLRNTNAGAFTFTNFDFGGDYATQVPEPASLGLLGLGCVFMMARRRKVA